MSHRVSSQVPRAFWTGLFGGITWTERRGPCSCNHAFHLFGAVRFLHLSTCSSMRPETYLSSYVLHVIPFLKTACLSMSHFFLLFACRPIHPSIPILPDPSFHPATDTHPPICSSICPSRPLMTPLYYNPLYLSHSTYIYLCLFTSI